MNIVDFENKHIEDAAVLALKNYLEEQFSTPSLPMVTSMPNLFNFAENGLGVAAFDGSQMIGFLCCYRPLKNAFNTGFKGVFSPCHAHGAAKGNRSIIYKQMYQAAAEKWVNMDIAYHSISLYAHDTSAIDAMFSYGFGKRCIDAIRPMESLCTSPKAGITFRELKKQELTSVRPLRKMLSDHMGKSPCFMYSSESSFQKHLAIAESDDTRIFVACTDDTIVAFTEIVDEGETFVTDTVSGIKHICGAFCLPQYRGTGIYLSLIDFVINQLKSEGYTRLSVEFESINPSAACFWPKIFGPYTNSLVRRIDDCALPCNIK